MYKTLLLLLGLITTLVFTSIGAAETYYKWVDDDNVTHYSKQPPKGRDFTKIQTSTGHSAPVAAKDANQVSNDKTAQTTAAAGPVKDKVICKQAQANLKTMQEHARIRQKDQYGEERLLTDEEKAEEIRRAREAIKTNC